MKYPQIVLTLTSAFAFATLAGCGKTPALIPGATGNIALHAAPLAGANAASLVRPRGFTVASITDSLSSGLLALLVGDQAAYAAVSSFASFKICNDTLVMVDVNGNTVAINGSTQTTGLGLLSFTSTSTTDTTLGAPLNIAAGTQIKEIDITSAISTTLCPGFSDAVAFDPGSGAIHISQNTAFKFKYTTPVTISGSSQTLSLLFGQIVNGMVGLGAGLTNSSIQTVSVGQAQ